MPAKDSLSNQFGQKLVGHQLDIFGGETPIYEDIPHERVVVPKAGFGPKKQDDFIEVHHRSKSALPPHEWAYPNQDDRYRGVDDHLFTGDQKAADYFSDRRYTHTYRVPKSAIYPVTYSDDSFHEPHIFEAPDHESPEARVESRTLNKKMQNPTLWHTYVASRRAPKLLKKVIPYTNFIEGVDWSKPEDDDSRYSTSYILPKGAVFDRLGIQYMGMKDNNPDQKDGIL